MSQETGIALQELAEITIADDEIGSAITDPREKSQAKTAKLIQDALRLYEWAVYQQSIKGREILAVPADAVTFVASKFSVDFEKESLPLLFEPEQMEAAKKFFVEGESVETKESVKTE